MKKWIATGLVVAAAVNLWAQAPEMFRYQGRLASGATLVNATLPMSFKLYNAPSGGTKLYEDSNSVAVVNGLYSTYVGDNTVFGSLTNAMTNAAVYLELTVNGETLSPRERLVSVPYALNAPAPAVPVVGDPAAVSNEVINARWTKNYYANGDITMSDRDTGLMWFYDASFAGQTNWYAAASYCDDLSYAGYSDWRLPRMGELGIQFYSSEYFTGVLSHDGYYWSGTSHASYTDSAWFVFMGFGRLDGRDKSDDFVCVWPVRGGQAPSVERVIGLDGNMDFGVSYATATNTAILTISNRGFKPLTVTGVSYSDAHFSGNWSGTLQPGGSTDLTVTFAPTTVQNYSGTITVNSDKTSGNNSIVCTGTGAATRYVDNGDGTVTDNATGLMWMQNVVSEGMSWDTAVAYCDNLVTNGYSDWRLPSVAQDGGAAELDTLFRANGNPSGAWEGLEGTPFTGQQGYWFWSGTSNASNASYAWSVEMSGGAVIWNGAKVDGNFVWPVRGGQ